MITFINKPYDLLESKSFRFLFIVGGGTFAFIFLWLFEPYGIYNLNTSKKALTVGLYIGAGFILNLIQFFPLQNIVIKKHTVLRTILWIMLSFVGIGTSSSIINAILFNEGRLYIWDFFYFQGFILSINIIPVFAFVLIHYNLTLKKRLKIAITNNEALKAKPQNSEENGKLVILNSENKNEGRSIPLNSLILISSMDNYIELTYQEKETTSKCLLRYSLSKVEQDNKEIEEIFRCHKGFIVNKTKIESITGNAAGYKLKLKNLDMLIPVSRKWNKEIKTNAFL